jgi:pimeloyl-ACP methyl ester carboxylesterase
MIRTIDVRDVLPGLSTPVLIIQRRHDRITPPRHGRYLAAHLPGARYFEQPGDHLLWLGDTDAMFAQIREFLAAARDTLDPGRVPASILDDSGRPRR